MREVERAISELLLNQHKLEQGKEVVYNGSTFIVDGMTICFNTHLVILTEFPDGYTPFDDFRLASPEAEKVSRRYTVSPEWMQSKEGMPKPSIQFWA
jgi:hypothetical protein